jgi:putative endonuclease
MAYTYILLCSNGSYYTGSTINLEKRLKEHNSGHGANYTANRLPVKLIYFEEFLYVSKAFGREKQIQGWSRSKKEALIFGRNEDLPKLARRKWYRRRS